MRFGGLILGSLLCLAPAAMAADDSSAAAVTEICSAESHVAPVGSVHELVMVPGIGDGGFVIATDKPGAQTWFNYGMQLAHAFYHEDAKLAFKRARELDPDCAMCAWGEAWADGPTINFDVSDADIRAAAALADKALLLADDESPKNTALIAALKVRYASHGAAADLNFAKAMDGLSRQYPDDDEIAILASDAWMIPDSLHDDKRGRARAVAVLEPVLRRHPNNVGAIHFYIHATESAGQAAKALPYAERLGDLAPGASHLVHMASHTFFRVGRYEDAAIANARAIGVDGLYLRTAHDASPQGSVRYHGHNLYFGLGGALASGDGPLALKLADHVAFAYPGPLAGSPFAQAVISHGYAAYGRYAPDRALALPAPAKTAAFATAMWRYARGEAFAAKGDLAGLRAELALVVIPDSVLTAIPAAYRKVPAAVTQVARLTLEGRAAMLAGDPKAAAKAYEAAVKIQDASLTGDYFQDPPPWWFPERRSLAAALLAQGQTAQAAAMARQALKGWPNEPLTLQVLGQAEQAAGDAAGAARDLAEARRGWHGAAVPLARL